MIEATWYNPEEKTPENNNYVLIMGYYSFNIEQLLYGIGVFDDQQQGWNGILFYADDDLNRTDTELSANLTVTAWTELPATPQFLNELFPAEDRNVRFRPLQGEW